MCHGVDVVGHGMDVVVGGDLCWIPAWGWGFEQGVSSVGLVGGRLVGVEKVNGFGILFVGITRFAWCGWVFWGEDVVFDEEVREGCCFVVPQVFKVVGDLCGQLLGEGECWGCAFEEEAAGCGVVAFSCAGG